MDLLNVAVTNLGKYNEGTLIFEWLKLPATEEEIQECFKKIGLNEKYEEYFITDYESDVGLKCSEYENLEELNEKIQQLEDIGDYDKLEAVIERDYNGDNLQHIIDVMEDDDVDFYGGMTTEDYVKEMIESSYNLDFMEEGWLSNYITIDYKRMAEEENSLYETDKGVLVDRNY